MNNKQDSPQGSVGIGASWILVIFVLLTLVSFGVLSLEGANADKRLCEKTLIHSKEYYAASNAANEKLAKIDETLLSAYKKGDYFLRARSELKDIDGVKISEFDQPNSTQEFLASFSQPISENQKIEVILHIQKPKETQDGFYKIKSWQTLTQVDWQPNENLPIYSGNTTEE